MSHPTRISTAILVLAMALSSAVWAQDTPQSYRLGAGDRLSITVLEAPDFNATKSIANDGSLTLPKDAGTVGLLGLTVRQAEEAIKNRLERELRIATVSITIDGTRASTVRLLGAVNSPGAKTIGPTTTLFELLTLGDEVKSANAGVVSVRRTSPTGLFEQVEIPLASLLQGLEPRYNLPLANGDLINVPAGEQITVYFVGEISKSVEFAVGEAKTLVRAIAKAGGLTERSSGKIVITRTLADGTIRKIEARYKRILNGREPDLGLERGDIIEIKRSAF